MTKYARDKIPGPEPHYLLGNVPDIFPDSLGNLVKLHAKYGPIVHLSMGGTDLLSVNDPGVLETICEDNEYFTKEIDSIYSDLAILNGRGLVTTSTADPDWQLGHKLIMNAFSARAMKAYHYKMGGTITELCEIMESFAKSGEDFDVSRWFIALALESIGKIGFDYDFSMLKDPDAPRHPFTVALAYVQSMIMKRTSTLSWLKWYQTTTNVRFHRDLQTLRGTVEDVLKDRREHPHTEAEQSDLLDFMIKAETKEGEKLNDNLIRDNIITFLSAGHNTTSAFLSWTLLELCKHPEVVESIKQEIANCGIKAGEVPTPEQVKECKYLDLVIKESLRIHPPITFILKYCKKDTTVKASTGDEYDIKAGQLLHVNINALHHNPKVWDDPDVFNPDRFAGDAADNLPNSAWLTFSNGPRACIGRQFALQEGKLALVMILSRFNFKMSDPNQKIGYAIIVSTKPVGFFAKVEKDQLPEPNEEIVVTKRRESKAAPRETVKPAEFPLPPVTFLYGTQTNTSEEYARKLSGQAKEMGFKDVTVQELDDWKLVKGEAIAKVQHDADAPSSEDDVKVSELVVVVTATYNGFPPDDAIGFSKWLDERTKDAEATKDNMLSGMLYAVFGCGNRDWASTFQKFPKKVDSGFELLGGERLLPAGEGDASEDIDGDFSVWSANFWTSLMQRYGQSSSGKNADIMSNNGPAADPSKDFTLEFINIFKEKAKTEQAVLNCNQLETVATVVENRELQHTDKSHRSTRHIQVQFEKSIDGKPLYEAGDHLEVVPVNEDRLVEIIATNLGLALDSVFEVKDLDIKNLSPRSVAANIKGPCTIRNALKYYADLTGPPTRFTLSVLSKQLQESRPDIAERLQKALQPGKETERLKEFLASHRTLIDIIQAFKIKELNFKEFISSVNCIVPRKYSISSGPIEHPFDPSISVGVVDTVGGPDGNTHYYGLASGYLSHQEPGTKINAQIKPCKSTFRLPDDPSTPVIFIAAGTGFSPFRGFLQERHAKGLKSSKKNSNGEGSECYMFFGCRHPEQDFIYKEEFDEYLEDGTITELFTTFSRSGEVVKYVQHALLRQANLLYKLMEESNAKVYICGSAGSMAKDVKRTWERLLVQMSGMSESEAAEQIQAWVEEGKYNEDVWGT